MKPYTKLIESYKAEVFQNNLEAFLKLINHLKYTVNYTVYANKTSSATVYSALVIYEDKERVDV